MLNVSAKVSSALSAGRVTRGRLWWDADGEGERAREEERKGTRKGEGKGEESGAWK